MSLKLKFKSKFPISRASNMLFLSVTVDEAVVVLLCVCAPRRESHVHGVELMFCDFLMFVAICAGSHCV